MEENIILIKRATVKNIDTLVINNNEYIIDVVEEHFSNGVIFVTAYTDNEELFGCQTDSNNYWFGDNSTWSLKLDVLNVLSQTNKLKENEFYSLINEHGFSIDDMNEPYEVEEKIQLTQVINSLRETNHFNNVSIGDEKKLITSLNEFLDRNKTFKLINVGIDFEQTIYFIFEVENTLSFVNEGKPTYAVLHAYFNGLSDRTTYYGLHRGLYDYTSEEKAIDHTKEKNTVFYIK